MASSGSSRHRARECVLQGLYERQLSGNAVDAVRARLVAEASFANADRAYFDELWSGVNAEADALIRMIAAIIDRPVAQLSPVERAVLVIGAWELKHRAEIPYRVVIDESIELAKSYGGTDGHRFVNGVLDKLAPSLRAAEVDSLRSPAGTA
jgi:transcription antitermination protein NusB